MSNAVKYYLAAYNLAAFLLWAAYLVCFAASGCQLTELNLLLLAIAQGSALLEIVHAILRWVKSPVLSTAAQVASRVLVVVLIWGLPIYFLHNEGNMLTTLHIGVIIVSIAWGLTELIRYSLYFLSLFDIQPRWLLWARYSFFIVLYPLGVTGEWIIILSPIIAHGPFRLFGYSVLAGALFISYAYYFPILYKYMWKQRKSKL